MDKMNDEKKSAVILASLFAMFAIIVVLIAVIVLQKRELKEKEIPATPPQLEAGEATVAWDLEPTEPAIQPTYESAEPQEEEVDDVTEEVPGIAAPVEPPREPIVEEKDPYEIFVTDEDWVKETNGYAVERNGKLYTLSALMPSTVITEYGCGYQTGGEFEEGRGSDLYLYDQREISDVPTKATNALISIGDFPIYYVDSGEELRVYSDEPLEEVEIKQAEFYGYTIPATGRQVTYFPIQDYIYEGLDGNITDPAVLTADGNPVEDVRKLEYGKQYMFEWYEGMDYHSQTLAATSRCYLVDDDNLAIKVPVKKTKEGYGIVDLSEVEPGNCYTISNVLGVFELR
ncbi:hypothetical protein IJG93_00310 [Candidatus Saccharibacteria bacterium]|nr:hypothetical protein [Candidatus Saccharibacteria bacterium]